MLKRSGLKSSSVLKQWLYVFLRRLFRLQTTLYKKHFAFLFNKTSYGFKRVVHSIVWYISNGKR